MDVRKLMTADPACCTPTTPLRDVARMMAENDCGEIPVVDDATQKHPIGVVTDRDIVLRSLAVGRDPNALTAGDCMTTPAVTTRPDCSVEDCRELMEAQIAESMSEAARSEAARSEAARSEVAMTAVGAAGAGTGRAGAAGGASASTGVGG